MFLDRKKRTTTTGNKEFGRKIIKKKKQQKKPWKKLPREHRAEVLMHLLDVAFLLVTGDS